MAEKLGIYFNYFKEEITIFKEHTLNLETKAREYSKKDKKLFEKKSRLYQEGNPKTWEIKPEVIKEKNITPKQLAEDKGFALKLMLPKVT